VLPLAETKQEFTHSKTPFAILLRIKIQNSSSSPELYGKRKINWTKPGSNCILNICFITDMQGNKYQ